ncbi:MAG: methyltransferase domain-containing protein [Actinomycetota bacterium]|nr:methyltransferase domain-containing protein [Actinomycetota bacterium]
MTDAEDPEELRVALLERWERSAAGWAARRERTRAFGMPVSERMIDAVSPQPGQRLLELAAGVGDTGLLAAERLLPGGTLVSSDATEGMLEAARARAAELGVSNVEFKRLELEWIDLPTAAVDAALCRWGLMFAVDPGAALTETRRVLCPGGRLAVAVWEEPEHNPWATITTRALFDLGLIDTLDPSVPGMFALAAPGRLADLLGGAGFLEVAVEAIDFEARYESVDDYSEVTGDLSRQFGDIVAGLSDAGREALRAEIASLAAPFTSESDGALRMPARSLVASASS